jgi:hypothetical protein
MISVMRAKKAVEPFNLFGETALISSKEEAAKILKDNSYYIFVSAFILLGLFVAQMIKNTDIGVPKTIILVIGLLDFCLATAIRILKSRLASILALTSFGYIILSRIFIHDTGGFFVFSIIFLAASYRAVRASFFLSQKS